MKKALGVLLVLMCLCGAAFFQVNPVSVKVASAAGSDGSVSSYFKLFDDTNGVYIIRENISLYNKDDVFEGSALLTVHSGVDDSGNAYSADPYIEWNYEAVEESAEGDWHTTTSWKKSDMFRIHVNPGLLVRSVSYWLPRAASAGKYGIRATAFLNGDIIYNSRGEEVSSVFVIMYAEELSYMYCADESGSSVYDVYAQGNGLGRTITANVFVNPGAVRLGGLEEVDSVGDFQTGGLSVDVGINPLNWHVEDCYGVKFHESQTTPIVAAENGRLTITLPQDLPRGNYVIRVYHKENDDVSGTYIIQNNGVFKAAGPGMEDAAPIMLIMGIIFAIIFGILFMIPRVAVMLNQMKFDSTEKQRFKKAKKEDLTAEFSGSGKRILDKKEMDKLSDAEKAELFKKRAKEASETKGNKFLSKMAENRKKRELAREVGMSVEEFKEVEDRLKKEQNAKVVSLSSFRKAIEEKTGIITTKQEEEIAIAAKAEENAHPKREAGEPEFEMLDSEKGAVEAAKEEAARSALAPMSGTERWKQALKEMDDDGNVRVVSTTNTQYQSPVAEPKVIANEVPVVDKVDIKTDNNFDVMHGEKSAENTYVEKPTETANNEKPSETLVEKPKGSLIVDNPDFIERPSFNPNLPAEDVKASTASSPEEKVEIQQNKPGESSSYKPEPPAEEKKEDAGSILSRLRRLAEEN